MSRLLVVIACLFVAVGHAQDPHSQATARQLFHEGLEHADAEDWEAAEDKFARAQTLRPAAAIALNLGIAREHLEHLVAASEAFRYVIRDASANPRLHERARSHLDAILPRLGQLVVELEGPREGVVLLVDEREASLVMVGVASPVDPGSHHVRIVRDELEVSGSIVEIGEGETRTVRLVIPPVEDPDDSSVDDEPAVEGEPQPLVNAQLAPAIDAPPSEQPESRPWFRRGWVWTLVGLAFGAVIGGAVAARRRAGDSQGVCDELSLGCIEP